MTTTREKDEATANAFWATADVDALLKKYADEIDMELRETHEAGMLSEAARGRHGTSVGNAVGVPPFDQDAGFRSGVLSE